MHAILVTICCPFPMSRFPRRNSRLYAHRLPMPMPEALCRMRSHLPMTNVRTSLADRGLCFGSGCRNNNVFASRVVLHGRCIFLFFKTKGLVRRACPLRPEKNPSGDITLRHSSCSEKAFFGWNGPDVVDRRTLFHGLSVATCHWLRREEYMGQTLCTFLEDHRCIFTMPLGIEEPRRHQLGIVAARFLIDPNVGLQTGGTVFIVSFCMVVSDGCLEVQNFAARVPTGDPVVQFKPNSAPDRSSVHACARMVGGQSMKAQWSDVGPRFMQTNGAENKAYPSLERIHMKDF